MIHNEIYGSVLAGGGTTSYFRSGHCVFYHHWCLSVVSLRLWIGFCVTVIDRSGGIDLFDDLNRTILGYPSIPCTNHRGGPPRPSSGSPSRKIQYRRPSLSSIRK